MWIVSNKNNSSELLTLYVSLMLKECSGETLRFFRYFKDGSVNTIESRLEQHRFSLILCAKRLGPIIGYGHLEPANEGEFDWLGICVVDRYQSIYWGGKIMQHLLDRATREIRLSVDKDNERAISLYNKFGFELHEVGVHNFFMKKVFDKSDS